MVYYNGEKFGEALRQLRQKKGLSQSELSKRSGLVRTHISMIERGLKHLTLETAFKIANGLEMDPVEFFSIIVESMKK